ncbi:MAG TPA: Gmad2 immunoglobulin-like domain-containing protein [Acidimicrobiales bacterium]|nr:Gmad2 immunoglobulin-like domain-containing protein [Acidimicrobiales bacterium]
MTGSRRALVIVVALMVVALGSWALAVNSRSPATSTTTTGAPATTTTAPPSSALWPLGHSDYTDPVAVARAFALRYLAMATVVTGVYRAGDSRSGEVDVRPDSRGPVTTVLVRQLSGASTWSVLGAVGQDLTITSPPSPSIVRSPLTVTGTSTAFEGVANLELRADGRTAPIASAVVHGGSMGVVGPFRGVLHFATPSARAGALILFTRSAKDGSLTVASVLRVWF